MYPCSSSFSSPDSEGWPLSCCASTRCFFSSRRRHTRCSRDWSSDVCSSDLLRIVPQGDLRSEIGSHIYFGGMVDETSAGVNPARYVTGLAHAAERAGAWLHDHTRVEEITAESQNGARKFRVRTSRGSIAARDRKSVV